MEDSITLSLSEVSPFPKKIHKLFIIQYKQVKVLPVCVPRFVHPPGNLVDVHPYVVQFVQQILELRIGKF